MMLDDDEQPCETLARPSETAKEERDAREENSK